MITEKGTRPSQEQSSVIHSGCRFSWELFSPLGKTKVIYLWHIVNELVSDVDFAKHKVLSVLSLFPDPNCSAKLHWKTPLVKDFKFQRIRIYLSYRFYSLAVSFLREKSVTEAEQGCLTARRSRNPTQGDFV